MSQSTYLKILISNGSKKLDAKTLESMKQNIFNKEGHFYSTDKEREDQFKRVGSPAFIPLETTVKRKSRDGVEYEINKQVLEPLPVWIDSRDGQYYYETISYDFSSDFRSLIDYYRLTGIGEGKMVEVSISDAEDIIKAIDYILLGKYDKDLERVFLEDNLFIEVLDSVYAPFLFRFRKMKSFMEDDRDYNYEDEDDFDSDGRYILERLRTAIAVFIHMVEEYKYLEDNISIKLVYELSI